MKNDIKKIVTNMTLEEKASMTSGFKDFFTTPIPRLHIKSIEFADGPHGLRKADSDESGLGFKGSTATCFPTAVSLASSWDENMLRLAGQKLGKQAKSKGVHLLLGPGANIKRSPLCGRNFEYFSEDPLLSSSLAKAYIQGVQSEGVGTSLKHFLANNQEYLRNTSSSEIDERTLREIYLASFEKAVKEAKPTSIMASYNKINGIYATEHTYFLQEILRKEWGYEGVVISDWGATHHRVNALKAGTDLTMPQDKVTDYKIVEAVKHNELDEALLDQSVERLLHMVHHFNDHKLEIVDFDKDHEIAKELAIESAVLLKNDHKILPLTDNKNLLFVGEFVEKPRFQGNGSSKVTSYKVNSVYSLMDKNDKILYSKGFHKHTDSEDEHLINDALTKAQYVDCVVVFAGLPDAFESEGFDRDHLFLPHNQNELIRKLSQINKNIVVVLHNGAPIVMPWINDVSAVIEMYLAGEAVSEATLDIIFGRANPSGRLAESFPMRLEDNPSYLHYFGTHNRVTYNEGVFVGYRYYTSKNITTLFPFGHGLSYATFEYSNLRLSQSKITYKEHLDVYVDVKNTSHIEGKEVIQLYVNALTPAIRRPLRELRAFEKIHLKAGEIKTVHFKLNSRSFSYWNDIIHQFHVASGTYHVQINRSATEVILELPIEIEGEHIRLAPYSEVSTIHEIMEHPKGRIFIDSILPKVYEIFRNMKYLGDEANMSEINQEQGKSKGLLTQPVNLLKRFLPHMTPNDWDDFFNDLNTADNEAKNKATF